MRSFLRLFLSKSRRISIYCGGFLAVLSVVDGIMTYIGITKYGITIEANPLVSFYLQYLGVEIGLIVVKIVSLFLLAPIVHNGFVAALWMLILLYATTVLAWAGILIGG